VSFSSPSSSNIVIRSTVDLWKKETSNSYCCEKILLVSSNYTLKAKNPEDKYDSLVYDLDLFRPHLFLNNGIFVSHLFMRSETMHK